MASQVMTSWGNVIRTPHVVVQLTDRLAPFPDVRNRNGVLPFGNGRSYGDSCLNTGGVLLRTLCLDKFIAFDPTNGVMACETGVKLSDILRIAVPHGWFLAVTPGTRFITIGGAIANDVHGKNHHVAGTFSRHLRRFELLRSNGERLLCAPDQNAQWFAATIGGLGLTGLITWAEIQLRRIPGPSMAVETIRYENLGEFMTLCAESDLDYEYTVAWVDCMAGGARLGRGLLQRARHAPGSKAAARAPRSLSVPLMPPCSLINNTSLRLFNTAVYHRQRRARVQTQVHYESFFYPLDGIRNLNRIYGPRGMYQYQCVIPRGADQDGIAALLAAIARSGLGSFLAVLKCFGDSPSVGLLSFPRPGVTLALDFPNRGERLERLLRTLDGIVAAAGGRIYPAKDGRMPGSLFRSGFPQWERFTDFIDPACSSDFWRRVMRDR
ncbi:MAG TPA: FAD-binding oxidoreductase [Steroidobacteraceae bacterium]|nr:FAD-binding oxidoreductase [Steroidobacteraceae bacterium]